MSEAKTTSEPSTAKAPERKTVDPRPEIEELSRIVSRVVQAGIASSTEAVAGFVRIHGSMLSDAATTLAKPLQSATEQKKKDDKLPFNVDSIPNGVVDMSETVDRSIKDMADLLDKSVRRFSDEYNKK